LGRPFCSCAVFPGFAQPGRLAGPVACRGGYPLENFPLFGSVDPNAPTSADLQQGWATLTGLFNLTFQTAQAEAGQLDAEAWRSLAEIQTRILKAAVAHLTLDRDNRPDTKILSRRALYLQTVIDLNRKIVDHWHPGNLLDEVVILIQQNFQYEYVNLFLLDQSQQKLELRNIAWKNQSPQIEDFISLKIGDQGIVGRVAATGRVVLVNDVSAEPQFQPHPSLPHVKAELAAPLLVGNNLVGVLDIESSQVNAFSEVDRQIFACLSRPRSRSH